MEHEVLLKDALPYIEVWTVVWTVAIIAILLILACHIWRFGKKHPEIFQKDADTDEKNAASQKAELRRQYHNKTMISMSVAFIWAIGMLVICYAFDGSTLKNQAWFLLIIIVASVLWVLSMIKRKPQK